MTVLGRQPHAEPLRMALSRLGRDSCLMTPSAPLAIM